MGIAQYRSAKPILKTIDIGRDGISVSADGLGTIHGITVFHPKHGLVIAEPYAQFDGTRFYDARYVRGYRTRTLAALQAGRPGFGLRFDIENRKVEVEFEGLGCASIRIEAENNLELITKLAITDDGEIVQSCLLGNKGTSSQVVRCQTSLGVGINRASYGQLTEGGPIPLPQSRNELDFVGESSGFEITNPDLGARLTGAFLDEGHPVNLVTNVKQVVVLDSPIHAENHEVFELPAGICRRREARFRLQPIVTALRPSAMLERSEVPRHVLYSGEETQARFIIRRNLDYILGNCAIPIPSTSDAVCLITDHIALPLGWNRDNYWQARFLLDVYQHLAKNPELDQQQTYTQLISRTLKGHLTWVFRLAQRPSKYWHRSYLVTGRPKDGAVFQLDQQCYPLLLLCDFLSQFPDEQAFAAGLAADRVIPEILDLIETKRDPSTGLYMTEETPGDDEVEYPFHFSSQVLLWHTLSKLSVLSKGSMLMNPLEASGPRQRADRLKSATVRHFLARAGPENQPLFVYLTNGEGLSKAYHDANDIPTLFAEAWGFCKSEAEIEAWQNTLRFAFSSANHGGYYDEGRFSGLGSVHTPGPWPLGYFQMWRFAQVTGDCKAEREAWEKICGSMQWDGLFSEAVDAETGVCISKAWFCWPGAMIGSGLLQDGVRERYL